MDTIGIIGNGFVGSAVIAGMSHAFNIESFDLEQSKSTVASIENLINKTKIIFICVPTPMFSDTGQCDISIVDKLLELLNNFTDLYIVIKSTLPPGTIKEFEKKFLNLKLIFNPEFLTEANAINDFKNQNRIILGSHDKLALQKISDLYKVAYPNTSIFLTEPTIAEMIKYTTNCYLAVKVAFANEIYQICQALQINYDVMIDIAKQDKRLGDSHWIVPGLVPSAISGKLLPGFGGTCLVKDINAAIYLAKLLNIDPKIMTAAWEKNLEVRPEYDWEFQIDRAISKRKI